MPKVCCVPLCKNNYEKNPDLIFYQLPSDHDKRQKWLQAIRKKDDKGGPWSPTSLYFYVCQKHFITEQKSLNPAHPDYVPSIFPSRPPRTTPELKMRRFTNSLKRMSNQMNGHHQETSGSEFRRGDKTPNINSRVCSCHFTKGLEKGPIWFPERVKGIAPVEEDTDEEEDDGPCVETQQQQHQAASGGVDCPASGPAQEQDQQLVVVHQDQGPVTGQLQVIPQGVTVIPSPGQQIMEVTLPDGQVQSCLFIPVAHTTTMPASSTATTTDAGRPRSATQTPTRQPARQAAAAPVRPPGRDVPVTDQPDSLQCVHCCITFCDAKGKMRHMRKSHREEYNQTLEQGNTIFSCYMCTRNFLSSEELCAHQHTHSREDKRYKCEDCDEGFYFLKELTTHRRLKVCSYVPRRRPGRPKKTPPSALPQGQSPPQTLS